MMLSSQGLTNAINSRSNQILSKSRGMLLLHEKKQRPLQRWFSSSKSFSSKTVKRPQKQQQQQQQQQRHHSFDPKQILNHKNDFMNKKHVIIPGSFGRTRKIHWGEETAFSLSEMAGHLSFVFVTLAYINSDIFWLRGLSMGSISLSIIFQYYRPQPLWIPIQWNVLLLAINSVMMEDMILERYHANRMPQRLQRLYVDGHFEQRGFDKIEFNKLFRIGKQATYSKGEFLTLSGESNSRLYFVIDGDVTILKDQLKLATVTQHKFIGELAFLNYMLPPVSSSKSSSSSSSLTVATADAMVNDDNVHVWVWEFEDLKNFLSKERAISNALYAYINHELRSKLVNTGIAMSDLHQSR